MAKKGCIRNLLIVCGTVLRTRVGTELYDIPGLGHSFITYPGQYLGQMIHWQKHVLNRRYKQVSQCQIFRFNFEQHTQYPKKVYWCQSEILYIILGNCFTCTVVVVRLRSWFVSVWVSRREIAEFPDGVHWFVVVVRPRS